MNYKVRIEIEVEVQAMSRHRACDKALKMLKEGRINLNYGGDIAFDVEKIDDGIYSEAVPDWALDYIFNGSKEGITNEEVKMIDNWMVSRGIDAISPPYDDESPYFTSTPPFGLPCDVWELDVTYKWM